MNKAFPHPHDLVFPTRKFLLLTKTMAPQSHLHRHFLVRLWSRKEDWPSTFNRPNLFLVMSITVDLISQSALPNSFKKSAFSALHPSFLRTEAATSGPPWPKKNLPYCLPIRRPIFCCSIRIVVSLSSTSSKR
jgi:hypothetical protein